MAYPGKSLSIDELDYLILKYQFELVRSYDLKNEYILVSCEGYDRKIAHTTAKSFWLNTPIRTFTISPKGIEWWRRLGFKYNLITVQNAYNQLRILGLDVDKESIENQIKRKTTEIKTI